MLEDLREEEFLLVIGEQYAFQLECSWNCPFTNFAKALS